MTDALLKAERFTWLASYPKSGNTYLRFLIEAYQSNGHIDINAVTATMGDNTSLWYQIVSPLPLNKLTLNVKMWMRPAVLFNQLNSVNVKTRFIKTHSVNASVNNLPHLIPWDLTERAIYIVRDPRDVVSSLQTYMKDEDEKPITMDRAAANMANPDYCIRNDDALPQVLTSWSRHVFSWVNETRYPVAVIRYEDLCADPGKELAELLAFCDLEVDADRIARAVEATRIENLSRQEQEKGFREDTRGNPEKPFFHKGGSRWQTELDPKIARRIEADHAEMMQRFDYLEAAAA